MRQDELLQQILGELKSISGRLSSLEKGQAKLEQKLEEETQEVMHMTSFIEQQVQELKQEVQEIKHRTIVVENELGVKARAAFDGYSLIYDSIINNEIRPGMSYLKSVQEGQSARIDKLEQRV